MSFEVGQHGGTIFQTDQLYYWKATKGWEHRPGLLRWWEVWVKISGINGAGGWWIRESWRYNDYPDEEMRYSIRSLSWDETQEMKAQIAQAVRGNPAPTDTALEAKETQ